MVAEIRGREKPDEWVLLGAHLDSSALNSGAVDEACNAALVIEAARDIQLTGVRPRRSIRFVLFGGRVRALIVRPDAGRGAPLEEGRRTSGSWTYLRAHHDELDRARAAILFDTAANRVNGFALNGRRDIESSVRETLKPIGPMGVTDFSFNVPLGPDSFDFLLKESWRSSPRRGTRMNPGWPAPRLKFARQHRYQGTQTQYGHRCRHRILASPNAPRRLARANPAPRSNPC